jgi:hypothetical protein
MTMAAKISLVLGSHAHVPYGADTGEFENVYTNLLKPFISGLYKYPQIQAALHYSGVLLHWVERSHPELFMLIEDMMARRQIEMLGGGFYEPMLPIIPLQDRIGQIELLTTYLRKQFGKRPLGCWVPAFAWEQNLVSPLASCGMNFTFLGERQFTLAADIGGNATSGGAVTGGGVAHAPCLCEDQGKLITVFPVLQSMETSLAGGKRVSALLEDFGNRHTQETELFAAIFPPQVSADQGEAADRAWNRFFEDLSRCAPFAETVMPGKLVKSLNNLQKRSFPDSSAHADHVSPRRFIITHPEAGGIYAKMVFTNVLINQLRGDKSRKDSAHEELWKAQDSSLFCRIDRQGLHNHILRNAAYGALLGAERITREKVKFAPSLIPFDFNMDGTQEWLFQDAKINSYVQSLGGGIFELDYLSKAWNYLNTCGGRLAFSDRLLPPALKTEKLAPGAVEGARLCHDERYESAELDKVRRKLRLVLRQSPLFPFGNIEIEKTYMLKKDTVCVGYVIINRGTAKETFQFAPEIDLALCGEGDAVTRFFACKDAQADAPLAQPLIRGADSLKIHDLKNEVQIILAGTRPFDGKIAPVYIPDNETGEKLFQAFCIMPVLPVTLAPETQWEYEFTLKFSH